MRLRDCIARWLAPQMAQDADAHFYLRLKLSDAADWLGYDYPEIDATIFWAKVCTRNHFRALGEPSVPAVPKKPWVHSIHEFREHLRATYPPKYQESKGGGR